MRIQHNIMSMNAYRNYNNNTSALSKNLEKLSSGYKINRAGDDAAGLAISEKMRAQIQGLNAAQKNVKDGISLVKTAEGAMQEIQDMLSRMKYLATQSANGTYEDDVDRDNLQAEVDKLLEEIDRIADSANFNGINLLDGSKDNKVVSIVADTSAGAKPGAMKVDIQRSGGTTTEAFDLTAVTNATIAGQTVSGVSTGGGASGTVDLSGTLAAGDSVTIAGNTYTFDANATNGDANKFKDLADLVAKAAADDITIDTTDGAAVPKATLTEDLDFGNLGTSDLTIGGKTYTYSGTAGVTGQWNDATELKALLTADGVTFDDTQTTGNISTDQSITGTWAGETIAAAAGTNSAIDLSGTYADGDTITIDGVTYDYADGADGSDGATFSDLTSLAAATAKNGIILDTTTDTAVTASKKVDVPTPAGGMQLQIGDTSDPFNQILVGIGDMHVEAMKIDGLDISTINTAATAIDKIKVAINYVSSVRGQLGAAQNRLDHTANNLSVMTENIQDAESTIRDTDVADEMMAYTKNNILIQSAQAMLAQANAVPQGVLQLLQ